MFYQEEVIEKARIFVSEDENYETMKGREIHSMYLYYIGENYYKNLKSKIYF